MQSPLFRPSATLSQQFKAFRVPAFWVTAGLFLLAALVPTAWPALDLAVAAPFDPRSPEWPAADWVWVAWINAWVPAVFRAMLLAALVLWLLSVVTRSAVNWRLPLAFVVVAGTLGPGAVVNLVFKDHWQRARPYQVQEFGGSQQFTRAAVITDQCDNNCSFVSGHVACGAFFVAFGLLHRRRQWAWAALGSVLGLTIGFARMAAAGHWLSDVLWAFPITLMTCAMVWWVLGRWIQPRGPAPQ